MSTVSMSAASQARRSRSKPTNASNISEGAHGTSTIQFVYERCAVTLASGAIYYIKVLTSRTTSKHARRRPEPTMCSASTSIGEGKLRRWDSSVAALGSPGTINLDSSRLEVQSSSFYYDTSIYMTTFGPRDSYSRGEKYM